MVKLPDPQKCPRCGTKGKVINSRGGTGPRWRQRQCASCLDRRGKPYRWNSYETTIDPTMERSRLPQNPTS